MAPLPSVTGFPFPPLVSHGSLSHLGDFLFPWACLLPGATLPPLPTSLPLPSSRAVSAIHQLPPCTFPCCSIISLEELEGMSSGSELRWFGMDQKTFQYFSESMSSALPAGPSSVSSSSSVPAQLSCSSSSLSHMKCLYLPFTLFLSPVFCKNK